MAYYYRHNDGVDDHIRTGPITFTDIYIELRRHEHTPNQYYFDGRDGTFTSPYMYRPSGSSMDTWSGVNVYVDGVLKTVGTDAVPVDKRVVVRIQNIGGGPQSRDYLTFFARFSLSERLKVDVFDIKIFNGPDLQAHYDFNTRTPLDQSGNGNHATLTGGSWEFSPDEGKTYYLEVIDSVITTPVMVNNRIVITAKHYSGHVAYHNFVHSSGYARAYANSNLQLSGFTSPNTIIEYDVVSVMDLIRNVAAFGVMFYIFNNNSLTMPSSADVYDIKIYNGETLMAHYDLTTGTLIDQTGNGYHAQTTGTWIEDGTSELSPLSVRFQTRQNICLQDTQSIKSIQQIHASRQNRAPTKQLIYDECLSVVDTKQRMWSIELTLNRTYQLIGKITKNRNESEQVISRLLSERSMSNQRIFAPRSSISNSLNRAYKPSVTRLSTGQSMYKIFGLTIDTKFIVHMWKSWRLPTLQKFFNPDKSIIRRIRLQASRVSITQLKANRIRKVNLRGDIITTTNQDIEMTSGEDLIFEVSFTEDLSGSTIKWLVAKTFGSSTHLISKQTGDGIEITNASNGTFDIILDRSETIDTTPGTYCHETWLKDVNGKNSRIMTGLLTIKPTTYK